MPMEFATIGLTAPSVEMVAAIMEHIPPRLPWQFSGGVARCNPNELAIPPSWVWPPPGPIRLGRVVWPTGASRWGYAHVLATSDQLNRILFEMGSQEDFLDRAGDPPSGTGVRTNALALCPHFLRMRTDWATPAAPGLDPVVEMQMRLVHVLDLAAVPEMGGAYDGLHMLTLADARYHRETGRYGEDYDNPLTWHPTFVRRNSNMPRGLDDCEQNKRIIEIETDLKLNYNFAGFHLYQPRDIQAITDAVAFSWGGRVVCDFESNDLRIVGPPEPGDATGYARSVQNLTVAAGTTPTAMGSRRAIIPQMLAFTMSPPMGTAIAEYYTNKFTAAEWPNDSFPPAGGVSTRPNPNYSRLHTQTFRIPGIIAEPLAHDDVRVLAWVKNYLRWASHTGDITLNGIVYPPNSGFWEMMEWTWGLNDVGQEVVQTRLMADKVDWPMVVNWGIDDDDCQPALSVRYVADIERVGDYLRVTNKYLSVVDGVLVSCEGADQRIYICCTGSSSSSTTTSDGCIVVGCGCETAAKRFDFWFGVSSGSPDMDGTPAPCTWWDGVHVILGHQGGCTWSGSASGVDHLPTGDVTKTLNVTLIRGETGLWRIIAEDGEKYFNITLGNSAPGWNPSCCGDNEFNSPWSDFETNCSLIHRINLNAIV